MSKIGWKGVLPVVVTPFNREGDIQENDLRTLVKLYNKDGVHGVIAAASTGEYYVMNHEERKRVFEIVAETAKEENPNLIKIANITALNPKEAIQFGKEAAQFGYDGVLLLPPTYATPSKQQIIDNYKYIAANIDLPIMLYNAPKWTGTNLDMSYMEELMKIENVKALKDSCKDIVQVLEVIRNFHDELATFTGFDTMIVPHMAVGGDGVVSMWVQVMGRRIVDLYNLCAEGKFVEAKKLQWDVSNLYRAYAQGTHYATIKEAMNQIGRPAGYPRLPLTLPNEKQAAEIKKVLQELNIL